MQMQQQQAQVRALIGQIAQNCFKTCVIGKPGSRLTSSEQDCMVRISRCARASLCVAERGGRSPAAAFACVCLVALPAGLPPPRQSNCTMRFLDATKFVQAKAMSQLQPKNDNAYE